MLPLYSSLLVLYYIHIRLYIADRHIVVFAIETVMSFTNINPLIYLSIFTL